MTELDAYLKAKHDVSNRLQLLAIYMELDQKKAAELVRDWMQDLQSEQMFLQLECTQFVMRVMQVKLQSWHRFKWSVSAALPEQLDDMLVRLFDDWYGKVEHEEPAEITVTINETITFSFSGKSRIEDLNFTWQQ